MKALRRALADGGLPLIWVALTALCLIPVWHQRLLPMLDAPNHLALARAWHNYSDPSYNIAAFYQLRVRPVPYFLFYFSIHLLLYAFEIETANKIFLSLYLILFPLSLLALARALGRSSWLALVGFPNAFNPNWMLGFSSYLMSTALMFFSLALLIRWLRNERPRDLALLFVSCSLCYLGHVLSWFTLGLSAIALVVLNRQRRRAIAWAAAAMLPSLALALASFFEERSENAFIQADQGFEATWRDLPTLVLELPRRTLDIFPGELDMAVFAVIVVTCLWLVYRYGIQGAEANQRRSSYLIAATIAAAYLLLPTHILRPMMWLHITQRLASLLTAVLFLFPAVSPTEIVGRKRWLFAPLILAAAILPLKLAWLYSDFDARNRPFMRLVDELPRGSAALVVVRGMMLGEHSEEKSGDPASSGPVYWHFPSWPMALKGGYGAYIFDQGIPVRPRRKLAAPKWYLPESFNPREADEFDYYLIRRLPGMAEPLSNAPELAIVDAAGDWTLFRRRR